VYRKISYRSCPNSVRIHAIRKKISVVFSSQANYTDRAAANCQHLLVEVCRLVRPTGAHGFLGFDVVNLSFITIYPAKQEQNVLHRNLNQTLNI
jgi:hypothetical protein